MRVNKTVSCFIPFFIYITDFLNEAMKNLYSSHKNILSWILVFIHMIYAQIIRVILFHKASKCVLSVQSDAVSSFRKSTRSPHAKC